VKGDWAGILVPALFVSEGNAHTILYPLNGQIHILCQKYGFPSVIPETNPAKNIEAFSKRGA
jgi:hypothetical protein